MSEVGSGCEDCVLAGKWVSGLEVGLGSRYEVRKNGLGSEWAREPKERIMKWEQEPKNRLKKLKIRCKEEKRGVSLKIQRSDLSDLRKTVR